MGRRQPFAFSRETHGPWALVTGASSGIGEAFARSLAARGLDLVLTARRKQRLDALAEELVATHGIAVEVVAADLSDARSLEEIARAVEGKPTGLLVSNAAMGLKGDHEHKSVDELTRLLHTNCLAPLLLTRHFLPSLRTRKRAGIILVGSMEGFLGFPHSAAYAASKAFVRSLGEGLWGELGDTGVDLLVLAPGQTDTAMLREAGVKPRAALGVMTPRQVAEQALRRLDQGPVFQTGRMNRLLVRFLTTIPRRSAIRMVGWGMKQPGDRA